MPGPSTPTRTGTPGQQGTPGSWKHPNYDEIIRRQDARSLSERNVSQITRNAVALLASFVAAKLFDSYFLPYLPSPSSLGPIPTLLSYGLIAIRLLFLYNILDATIGSLRKPDLITDIPLTPSQRAALSLPPTPTSVSAIAGDTTQYITPPRYTKSSSSPLLSSPLNNSSSAGGVRTPTNGTPQPTTPVRSAITPFGGAGGKVPRVTAQGSPVGPGQNLLASPVSFSPGAQIISPSPLRIGNGGSGAGLLEKRHSFGSPMGRAQIGAGAGGAGGSIMGTMAGGGAANVNTPPSVVASGKWLHEARNRRRDIF